MDRTTFDRLFAQGCGALVSGTHERQVPPIENGPRRGTSVISRPNFEVSTRIDDLTQQAEAVSGGDHWPTGSFASAHLTVRAWERHRAQIAAGDRLRARYEAALNSAAAKHRGRRASAAGQKILEQVPNATAGREEMTPILKERRDDLRAVSECTR